MEIAPNGKLEARVAKILGTPLKQIIKNKMATQRKPKKLFDQKQKSSMRAKQLSKYLVPIKQKLFLVNALVSFVSSPVC